MPRSEVLGAAQRVVVKIGTQLMTREARGKDGRAVVGLDSRFIGRIAGQIAALYHRGVSVTLVSSGAVGAGCIELGRDQRPTDIADAQAVAAVGQRRLLTVWANAFKRRGLGVGQVLLTRSDFDDRARFLNIRNCVSRLQSLGCVPILNENDAVAVDELRFGDNDLLAGLACNAIRAELLVMLTVVEGLWDEHGQVVPRVDDVLAWRSRVRDERSGWGSGGMGGKLEAARVVTEAGQAAIIANGRQPEVLHRVLGGEELGTLFLPGSRKMDARRRWIGLTVRPAGTVTVDDGAARALTAEGASLLARGITGFTGRFQRGDVLLIRDPNGREIGRGLTDYTTEELRLAQGRRTDELPEILGGPNYAAVIHRNNMVVSGAAP